VFEQHDTGVWHPERSDRVGAVRRGVFESGLEVIEREPPILDVEMLYPIHNAKYVASIKDFCAAGGGHLDADTVASKESWEAALRSAGAGPAAAEALEAGVADTAFLAVRPPGHHALSARAMGFCLFNNIAVTASHLAAQGKRVAILDWDVHHGNGTQTTFYESGEVLYISLHEFPFYPGSGWLDEDGNGAGTGLTVNLPLPAATAGDVYDAAFTRVVVPILKSFAPDWLLFSAGFDALAADPLADLMLEIPDYARMSYRVSDIVPVGRTMFFLEGGYHLEAMQEAVAASLQGLAGAFPDLTGAESPIRSWQVLDVATAQAATSWDVS